MDALVSRVGGPNEISLEQFNREVVEVHAALCRYMTETIYEGLIVRSPVLSGSFRRNWNVTNSARADYTFVYTPKQGGPVDARGTITFAEVEAPFEVARPILRNYPFPAYTIANGAWYGYQIEVTGWKSGKPPYKPVALTMLDVLNSPHSFTVFTSHGRSRYTTSGGGAAPSIGGTALSAVGGGLFP